jgi:hypothetical protein
MICAILPLHRNEGANRRPRNLCPAIRPRLIYNLFERAGKISLDSDRVPVDVG